MICHWSGGFPGLIVDFPSLDKHSAALEGFNRDQSSDVFVMPNHEVKSLFDGLRWFGLWKPLMVLIDMFYEIPHSYLEYGMRVIG